MIGFKQARFLFNHPLTRNQKIKSFIRFISWQLGSRLLGKSIVHEWVCGSKFLARKGETGITGNIYAGLHEFNDMGFLLHVLREEDLFVDVGANIGSYTILASAAVGAKTIAFEPARETFDRLIDNIRINGIESKVEAINKGVGEIDSKQIFSLSLLDTKNHILPNDQFDICIKNKCEIEVVSLDNVLKDKSPTFIKIDVEGYEKNVLLGSSKLLKNESLNVVIVEINGSGKRYGINDKEIIDILTSNNFKMYEYHPLERRLELNNKDKFQKTQFLLEIQVL